ncbi:MAG: hypothetical protein ACLTSG_06280 [Lachnospiraceae bacterium]
MTDYLAARDYDGAARTLADLMSMGEEPIAILAVIGMQMRRLYATRVALDEKLGGDFVRENCGVKFDFTARQAHALRARLATCARWSAQSASVPKRTMP